MGPLARSLHAGPGSDYIKASAERIVMDCRLVSIDPSRQSATIDRLTTSRVVPSIEANSA